MNIPLKVLWCEGVTIGPHQLQQMDRYHETRLQQIAMAINPCLWGVRKASWNVDALTNNILLATELSLVFQDGEIYDAPLSEQGPAAVDLSTLPDDCQTFTYYAALPFVNGHGQNMEADSRYARTENGTADLFSRMQPAAVAYLAKNVRLLPHTAARGAYFSIPVVRIRRATAGGFELDPTFMPPAVTLASTAGLATLLDALLAKLNTKIAALYERHRMNGRQAFEVYGGDFSTFWMLNVICTASAPLTHCANFRHHHPEYVFDRMTALAGGLMTFSPRYTLADLPRYQHDAPGPGFEKIDAIIRDLIDTVISSRYFAIPLASPPARTSLHQGVLDTARVDHRTQLCLAVSADMPALELVAAVPKRFKIGSPDDVERMISSALPGVEVVHMAQLPNEIPVRPNTYYFSLTPHGKLYEEMLKSQAISLYTPAGMKELRIELFGIAP
ncbi:type VI secretion system baseplate subunit TssK [Pseudoduganella umbonata]|uniref:Type VI secretion system baseplate subunit TssK n=1 Tax=Pseudoduganella umbonata TaxID=864828 RepID=A0A4P8HSS3_9BURK|nr:type VI secretion system baseplate subunit TssK [Pseudoduganella umbonata]MBB3222783.1 type VI secretion system protein ImpJ [Pseudoduganella umbonata]QCP12923.1 type VI secretion system baseplate subunit TssK [Pseudoduganella umbonata]